ncbi:MAG: hypothetical protein GWO16_11725 [Gammaproteobacteria bacterium]|nr:hypothetical protein [Gammaproteobacteria bacterium]NIR98597.1 hypothetical protein [Gammaproteobacteria bacterium]NIT64320.1 hypothetical protein [Gammaproteobacteria bacterium]NIV21244.1 hypothetical protein [Gammaproteobacteria bacterium]NIX10948.1 hypothetical protein [Gammaproteobacteria bacterium]
MTSNTPPAPRVWWKAPVEKSEIVWVILALVWCLILSLWRPYSQFIGEPGPRTQLEGETVHQGALKTTGLSRGGHLRPHTRSDTAVGAHTPAAHLPESVHAKTPDHERTDAAEGTSHHS